MKFRTEIDIPPFPNLIEHNHKILALGSCFTISIGEYFEKYKFNILKNPFGVLYNPASIYNAISIAASNKQFTEQDLVYAQGEYHSFYHHTDFSHHELEQCLHNINTANTLTHKFLQNTDWIFLSLGTSYVFRLTDKDVIVSNCHKIPADRFVRSKLSYEQVKHNMQKLNSVLKNVNKNIKIVYTVSPIRHWKDGAVQNQLSKSTLLLAIDNIIKTNSNTYYFPSYELLMDDLRDYRFYKEDLLHPNDIAINYIWEKLKSSLLSDKCNAAIDEITKVINAASHRVRNPLSEQNQSFAANSLKIINELTDEYPYINFEEEREYFKNYTDKGMK